MKKEDIFGWAAVTLGPIVFLAFMLFLWVGTS